mgnify:CR=1 FL=1|tara:strand:- start:3786 stop:4124 length:339 start_codon:yes stop_codon:yes gene_type:complete
MKENLATSKKIFHWVHVVYGVYVMAGGFFPHVWLYNWVSTATIFTWVLFGRCIANDGYDYNKGSLMEEVLGDGGIELFNNVLLASQVTTAIRLGNPMSLIVFIIYKLKELSI